MVKKDYIPPKWWPKAKAVLDAGGNQAEAAKKVGVHWSTVSRVKLKTQGRFGKVPRKPKPSPTVTQIHLGGTDQGDFEIRLSGNPETVARFLRAVGGAA